MITIPHAILDHTVHNCGGENPAGEMCSTFFRIDHDAATCPESAAQKALRLATAQELVTKLESELAN